MFGNKKNFFLIACALVVVCVPLISLAQTADTDFDGLSDADETSVYYTDPNNPDTDADGVSDGTEIQEKTDPLDEKSSLLSNSATKFMWTWYLGRASGIVAFLLFSAVVIYGLLMSTGMSAKLGIVSSYESHRFLSWMALTSTVVHFTSFFFDDFVKLSPLEAFVPFLFDRDFLSVGGYDLHLSVAFGVIALYLGFLVAITAEFRMNIAPKMWRKIHYTAFAFYILMVLHGFFSGSDSNAWWMRTMYIASVSVVFFLVMFRIFARPKGEKLVSEAIQQSSTPRKIQNFQGGNFVKST